MAGDLVGEYWRERVAEQAARLAALEAEVARKDVKLATYCDYLESLQPWVWGHERREMVAADITEVRTALGETP